MSIQFATRNIQTVNTQHFIIVNIKQLHVSAVQGSHHQAICFTTQKKTIMGIAVARIRLGKKKKPTFEISLLH